MAVIKSQNAQTLLKEAIVLDMGDLRRQATALHEMAQQKAQRIVADAQTHAQQLIDSAHSKGYDVGHAKGYEEGLAKGIEQGRAKGHADALAAHSEQLKQLQQSWLAAASAWSAQREEMDRLARQAVLDLSLAMAQKLVHRIVEIDRSVVIEQVAQALACVLRPMDVSVRIHPDDRDTIQEAMPQLMAEFPQLKRVHLVEDANVGRGGCVMQYGQGRVDATVQTQLRRVVELMVPDRADPSQADAASLDDDDASSPSSTAPHDDGASP